MATWLNRWEGDVLFTKTSGMLTLDEARQTLLDHKAAMDAAPGRFGTIVDLSEYPTQLPEVVDFMAEFSASMDMEDPRQVCMALVVAKTTTKMQMQRLNASGQMPSVYCDDLDEARAAVKEILAAPAPV